MTKLKLLCAATAVALFLTAIRLQAPPPAAAAFAPSEVGAVLDFAANQLHKPYRLGADGMRRYDCSGFVYRTFMANGLVRLIGGDRRANGYYKWFKNHGQITRQPQEGDLVVWAHRHKPVSHIGIFDGFNRRGQPMAISALVNPYGVTRHRVFGIHLRLKAYLHVDLTR